jgi:predicted amidohydrolase YtcJ
MSVKIFLGVPVYTMDDQFSVQEALVVVGDRVRFIGNAAEAIGKYPEAEKIELAGGCIVPGFIDAHLHLQNFSLLFNELDLYDEHGVDGILERIREASADKKREEWITGGGADMALLNSLSRDDVDEACRDNPLVVYSRGMYCMLLNSAALAACHIDATRKNPIHGSIERDGTGRATGLLRGRACELVARYFPERDTVYKRAAMERGIDKLVAAGVTTFCDCSLHRSDYTMRALLECFHRGGLKARSVIMFSDRTAVRLGTIGLQSLFGNEKIRIGGCELILDGTLATMTAQMSRPYEGMASSGMLLMEEQELHRILIRCYTDNIWTGVHANGDRAVEIALHVYESIEQKVSIPGLPKRIEHAQSLKDEDIGAISRNGVIPVMCPEHIPIDREYALTYLGPLARQQHRLGSLVETGATVAIGSDAPVGSVNPLHGLYAAVERKDMREGPELRFFPRERIGLRDAMMAYTRGSAAAMGLQSELGSLETGKYADLVVLSEDILGHDAGSLPDTSVVMTVVGGETVYQGKND